jgi:DNA-binding HxlR family transcriptional regulator
VGEWWTMLIMREALEGMTRFDEFQKSLGIAPNMLARRLDALVEAGLLKRRRYCGRPPRDEYVPTAPGRDFRPVLVSLMAWATNTSHPKVRASSFSTARPAPPSIPSLSILLTGGRSTNGNTRWHRGRRRDPEPGEDMRLSRRHGRPRKSA